MTLNSSRILLAAAAASFAVSCASTHVTGIWRKEGFHATPYANFLVIDIAGKESIQKSVEDSFATQLKSHGVNGTPCHALGVNTKDLDQAARVALVKSSGADAALLIRLVKVEEKTSYSPTYSSPHNDIYDSWDGAWVGAYYPPTEYTYDVVFLEAKLFDVKSEELVWAASTETADPGKVDREIAKYTSIILGALRRDGLLGK